MLEQRFFSRWRYRQSTPGCQVIVVGLRGSGPCLRSIQVGSHRNNISLQSAVTRTTTHKRTSVYCTVVSVLYRLYSTSFSLTVTESQVADGKWDAKGSAEKSFHPDERQTYGWQAIQLTTITNAWPRAAFESCIAAGIHLNPHHFSITITVLAADNLSHSKGLTFRLGVYANYYPRHLQEIMGTYPDCFRRLRLQNRRFV